MTPEPTVEQPTAIRRSVLYRAYPTRQQVEGLESQIASCRWVYNQVIETHIRVLQRGVDPPENRSLEEQLTRDLPAMPRGSHLRAASVAALRMAVREADAASRAWRYGGSEKPHWRRAGAPGSMSYYPTAVSPEHGVMIRKGEEVAETRIPKVGWIRIVAHRDLLGRDVRLTIKRDSAGRWWVTVTCEIEVQHEEPTGRIAAVDVGAGRTLAWVVWIDRETGEHGRYSIPAAKIDHRQEQRRLDDIAARRARCEPGSRRHKQISQRLARRRASLQNRRREAARLMAQRILDDVDMVVVESLSLRGLVDAGGPGSGRLLDAGMGEALRELRSIAERRGKRIVAADRFLASTHLCAVCDRRTAPMPLRQRTWTCRGCGAHLHRDFNAALNLLRHTRGAGAPPVDARVRQALAGRDGHEKQPWLHGEAW